MYYPTIKPFDANALVKSLKKTKKLFAIEEHCTNGGGVGYIQEAIVKNKLSIKSSFLTLANNFIKDYGEHEDLKKSMGFSKKNFIKKIKKLLKND